MYELKLNISDVELVGSGNSIDFMPEVLTKYQVNANINHIKKDAYLMCMNNTICGDIILESASTIKNEMYSYIFK